MALYEVHASKLAVTLRAHEQERRARVIKAIQDTVRTAGPAIAQEEIRHPPGGLRQPINAGEYARSWKAEKVEGGAVLFNDAPYAIFVERGRRPGAKMPPRDVIERWLEQKMRGQVRNRGKRLLQAKQLAFVVARAIGRRGLPAHRVMERTKARLDAIVRRAVEAALRS